MITWRCSHKTQTYLYIMQLRTKLEDCVKCQESKYSVSHGLLEEQNLIWKRHVIFQIE